MRKLLSYTLLALLLGGLFFLFWDEIPSFWKKAIIIFSGIIGIFACKDFISWAFNFILKKFSSLFKWFIALVASFLLFWFGYNSLPENGSVKTNIDEIKSSTAEFFKIPKPTAGIADKNIVIIPSTKESERNSKTLNSKDISSLTTKEGERIRIYTDSSSNEITRNEDNQENTNTDEKNTSIDPLDALFAKPETNNREEKTTTSPELNNEQKEIEEEIEEEITLLAKENEENEGNEGNNSSNKNEENTITELSFSDDSEKNWKTPVVQILNSPEATNPVIIKTKGKVKVKTAKKTKIVSSSHSKLPSSGIRNEKFKILFRELPVQITYPIEYTLTNTVWTDKDNTLDTVSFTVTTPQKKKANVTINITNSGKLYMKYYKSFINNNSTDENLFFIESTSPQSISYVSFFAGNCWEITINIPDNTSPTLNDFYKILLPAVFESQE